MNLSELHPDELLWREACGTLTPDERADLSAHLQRCPACVLERVVRMEAARARVPSEADHALAARLVDRVLTTHQRRPAAAIASSWRRPLAVAAAAVVLVAGTAFAATALVVRVRAQRTTRDVASGSPAPSLETPARRRAAEAPEVRPPDPASVADRGVSSRKVPGPMLASAARERRSPRDGARSQQRPFRPSTLAHAAPARRTEAQPNPANPEPPLLGRAVVIASPPSSPPSSPPWLPPALDPATPSGDPVAPEAPQLLRRAEQAKTSRRWADASRAFAELGRRYPGTREEIVSRALHGQLLLEQLGEPRRALTMFDRYLAADRSGALTEEARLGRAQAWRVLGRADEERSAWRELVREHPGSVHVAAARKRLAALDAP